MNRPRLRTTSIAKAVAGVQDSISGTISSRTLFTNCLLGTEAALVAGGFRVSPTSTATSLLHQCSHLTMQICSLWTHRKGPTLLAILTPVFVRTAVELAPRFPGSIRVHLRCQPPVSSAPLAAIASEVLRSQNLI